MADEKSRFAPGAPEPEDVEYPAAPTPGLYLPPDATPARSGGRRAASSPSRASRSSAKSRKQTAAPTPGLDGPAFEAQSAGSDDASPPRPPVQVPPLVTPPRPARSRSTASRRRARADGGVAPSVASAAALASITAVLAVLGKYAFLAWLTVVPALAVAVMAVAKRERPRRVAIGALAATIVAGVVSIAVFSATMSDDGRQVADPTGDPAARPTSNNTYAKRGPNGEIGDGLWRVGQDIEPGLYRAVAIPEPDDNSWGCDWFTYSSAQHSDDNTIDSMWGGTGLPIVDLNGVAEFETDGCGEWELMDPDALFDNADAPATIAPGMWLIGEESAPGTYRPSKPVELAEEFPMCFWVVFDGPTSSHRAMLSSGIVYGGLPTVALAVGQTFESKGCGSWAAVDPAQFFQKTDAPTQFPQGVWLVGEDIAPGTYSTAVAFVPEEDYSYCSWSIAATWDAGQYQSIESNSSQDEGIRTVTLETGQRFDSDGCGDWVLTGP